MQYCDELELKEVISEKQLHRINLLSKCDLCLNSVGFTIKCALPNCKTRFHLSCGLQYGYIPEYYEGLDNFLSQNIYTFYCETHKYKYEKSSLTKMVK